MLNDKDFKFYLKDLSEISEGLFAELTSFNYKKDEEGDIMEISNHEREQLIEMFEVISQASDHCLYLMRDFDEDFNAKEVVESILPRGFRIQCTLDEVYDLIENINDCQG